MIISLVAKGNQLVLKKTSNDDVEMEILDPTGSHGADNFLAFMIETNILTGGRAIEEQGSLMCAFSTGVEERDVVNKMHQALTLTTGQFQVMKVSTELANVKAIIQRNSDLDDVV